MIPAEIRAAARRRSEARAARDWVTADALRDEIEAAGWRVIDVGTDVRLEPMSPPDIEVGGEIRYGRSDVVPSRLDEPAVGVATVVLVVEPGDPSAIDAVTAAAAAAHGAPGGVDLVVVGDGIGDPAADGVRDALASSPLPVLHRELVRTSAPLGRGAALNAGIRRARAPIVIVLDPSIQPTGDVVSPLVAALDDPIVAVAGPLGLLSGDLRRFEEVTASSTPIDAAAIQGYLMAFRRADFSARGPLDEAFRFYRNLDVWWSLVLRDEGEGVATRRAVVVPDLPLVRREPWAWTSTSAANRERLSKRNFYRILDRFRTRADLAVPGG
jgi:GT2 family glycosyltransferase